MLYVMLPAGLIAFCSPYLPQHLEITNLRRFSLQTPEILLWAVKCCLGFNSHIM